MDIGIEYLFANNGSKDAVREKDLKLVHEMEDKLKIDFVEGSNEEINFIFVEGGGTETQFRANIGKYKTPIYLIATDRNNSLGSSIEILSYLQTHNIPGKIIHGSDETIMNDINKIIKVKRTKDFIKNATFARIGQPSDWLISSGVKNPPYKTIDITMDEFIDEIKKNSYVADERTERFMQQDFNEEEKERALYVYGALERLIVKYGLDGVSVRCYDLIDKIKTTACIAVSLLNSQNVYAACEGDMPALYSMAIINQLTGKPAFMANPSSIDFDKGEIIFAHCTLPYNMTDKFKLDTHYESDLGVALKAEIHTGRATVFKTDGERFYASNGEIVANLNKKNLCRTQISMKLDRNLLYFTREPIGNHHLIVNGAHADVLYDYFTI